MMSRGVKMRVAIARATALEPDILLMGEPFVALDAHGQSVGHAAVTEIQSKLDPALSYCIACRAGIFTLNAGIFG